MDNPNHVNKHVGEAHQDNVHKGQGPNGGIAIPSGAIPPGPITPSGVLTAFYNNLSVRDADDDVLMEESTLDAGDPPSDCSEPPISVLEDTVAKGKDVLHDLLKILDREADWRKEIEDILQMTEKPEVTIGLIGGTGAGKSSLVNALIDDEHLLPTSSMRAATSVPTEVVYNHGEHRYKAEVKFIQREEWQRELEILFGDMVDGSLNPSYDRNKKEIVDAARERVKVVYPGHQNVQDTPIQELVDQPPVARWLGTTHVIEGDDPRSFAKELQWYIDSKGGLDSNGSERTTRLWPLIRVVRLHVKAKVLETGAVLVDLPGIQDSNAARVAVTQEYLKRCSAYWIVSGINRAVNDSAAQSLTDRLKLQLGLDCALGSISFVCTKTDDIVLKEVEGSLQLPTPSFEEDEERQKVLTEHLKELERAKEDNLKRDSEIVDEISRLERGQKRHEDLPLKSPLKRTWDSKEVMWVDGDSMDGMPDGRGELHALYKESHNERAGIYAKIGATKNELEELKAGVADKRLKRAQDAIRARNDYSKQELREYFAELIREMGGETLHGSSPGQQLPVFCISANAFWKLKCPRPDAPLEDFSDLDQTEIPQLQRHCVSLTEKPRRAYAQLFLARLKKLLQSLSLWSSATRPAQVLSEEKKEEMKNVFEQAVANVRKGVDELQDKLVQDLRKTFEDNIFQKLDNASTRGSDDIRGVVLSWEERFKWNTWKAICRRLGIWHELNWNKELADPMLNSIQPDWTRTFRNDVPGLLRVFLEDFKKTLDDFDKEVSCADGETTNQDRADLERARVGGLNSLTLGVKQALAQLREKQKGVNRLLDSVIATKWEQTYVMSAGKKGPGMFREMQSLAERKARDGSLILKEGASQMKSKLLYLSGQTGAKIDLMVKSTQREVTRDYHEVVVRRRIYQFNQEQIGLRTMVLQVIQQAENELQLDNLGLDVDEKDENGELKVETENKGN